MQIVIPNYHPLRRRVDEALSILNQLNRRPGFPAHGWTHVSNKESFYKPMIHIKYAIYEIIPEMMRLNGESS